MSLKAQLDAFRNKFESQAPQDALDQMHQATNDLRASGILSNAVSVGDQLPAFSLQNQDGAAVSSADFLAKGPLVISFFRGGWCPYCMVELKALSDIATDMRAAGGEIVVISPQTVEKSQKTYADNGLDLNILSDPGNSFASQLGIRFVLPENIREIYKALGNFTLPDYNGDDSHTPPMPTRLVVRQDGTVSYAEVDADYTVRPEPADTLAALRGVVQAAA